MKNYRNFNKNNKCSNCNNCKCKKDNFSKEMELFELITELQFKIDSSINVINNCIVDLDKVTNILKGINGKV